MKEETTTFIVESSQPAIEEHPKSETTEVVQEQPSIPA